MSMPLAVTVVLPWPQLRAGESDDHESARRG